MPPIKNDREAVALFYSLEQPLAKSIFRRVWEKVVRLWRDVLHTSLHNLTTFACSPSEGDKLQL